MKKGLFMYLPKSQNSPFQVAARPAGRGQGWVTELTHQSHTSVTFQAWRIYQVGWSAILAGLWQANQTQPSLFSLLTTLVG